MILFHKKNLYSCETLPSQTQNKTPHIMFSPLTHLQIPCVNLGSQPFLGLDGWKWPRWRCTSWSMQSWLKHQVGAFAVKDRLGKTNWEGKGLNGTLENERLESPKKWRCGSDVPFSIGWFCGWMLIFRGVFTFAKKLTASLPLKTMGGWETKVHCRIAI